MNETAPASKEMNGSNDGAVIDAAAEASAAAAAGAGEENSIEYAKYPLPPPLAKLLSMATSTSTSTSPPNNNEENGNETSQNDKTNESNESNESKSENDDDDDDNDSEKENFHFVKESPIQALTNVLENSISALDQWYFYDATTPEMRQAWGKHRTCLRIALSTIEDKTKTKTSSGTKSNNDNNENMESNKNASSTVTCLTITDLGVGMTRADLINLLGVGRPLKSQVNRLLLNKTNTKMNSNSAKGKKQQQNQQQNQQQQQLGKKPSTTNAQSGKNSKKGSNGNGYEQVDNQEYEHVDEYDSEDDEDDGDDSEDDDSEDDDDDEDDSDDGDESGEEEDDDGIDDGYVLPAKPPKPTGAAAAAAATATAQGKEKQVISCKTNDLGGFYSAVCALAVGVKVGTKSKFDDYYEFQVGQCFDEETNDIQNKNDRKEESVENNNDTVADGETSAVSSSHWKEFIIRRPMAEGVVPSVKTGMTNLTDVRGSSGTSVTLYLHPSVTEELLSVKSTTTVGSAVPESLDGDAEALVGIDDAHQVLLSHITKILETTQYTFAIQGVIPSLEEQAIIEASEREDELLQHVLVEQEEQQRREEEEEAAAASAIASTATTDDEEDVDDDDDEEERAKSGKRSKSVQTRIMMQQQQQQQQMAAPSPMVMNRGPRTAGQSHAATNDKNRKTVKNKYDYNYMTVKERAKYIPLRLSLGERKLLRLVEAAMNCCDYTTVVDRPYKSPVRRLHQQLKGVMSVLRGLITSCDYAAGQKLAAAAARQDGSSGGNNGDDDDETNHYEEYQTFLRRIFEIARRHKIMNPEKMRTEYGKLVYLLQDAVRLQQDGHLDGTLTQSLIAPIQTVYTFLQQKKNGLALLDDKLIEVATEEILATNGKPRHLIDAAIRRKERAVSQLKRNYSTTTTSPSNSYSSSRYYSSSSYYSQNNNNSNNSNNNNNNSDPTQLTTEDIHLCLYSICDNNSFLNSNRVPIDKIIDFLQDNFSPTEIYHPDYSLSIISGQQGSRLSHSHERQYYFALQSLTLWRDIVNDMFRLWAMAEQDLLQEAIAYKLQDTGQGMQRVQQSPQTYRAMQQILYRLQNSNTSLLKNHWVGSSVIHLGDHNVPNALSFIDKYTQVPRILGPIVNCLEQIEKLYHEDTSATPIPGTASRHQRNDNDSDDDDDDDDDPYDNRYRYNHQRQQRSSRPSRSASSNNNNHSSNKTGIRKLVNDGYGTIEKLKLVILYDFFTTAFDGSGANNFYDAGSCIDGRLTSVWNWCSTLPTKPYYHIFLLTGFIGFDGEFK